MGWSSPGQTLEKDAPLPPQLEIGGKGGNFPGAATAALPDSKAQAALPMC